MISSSLSLFSIEFVVDGRRGKPCCKLLSTSRTDVLAARNRAVRVIGIIANRTSLLTKEATVVAVLKQLKSETSSDSAV